MPLGIDYTVGISIEGESLSGLGNAPLLLSISESCHQVVPTMEMQFLSDYDAVKRSPLYDGQRIGIAFHSERGGSEEEEMHFQLFNYKIVRGELNRAKVELSGVYQANDLLRARIESFEGPSTSVFSDIASRSGLGADVGQSNDEQVWIRPGVKGGRFLNDVANHAWGDESSFYSWGLTRTGVLVFHDVHEKMTKAVGGSADWHFQILLDDRQLLGNRDEKQVFFIDPIQSSEAGGMNNLFGYGMGFQYHDLNGELQKVETEKFDKTVPNVMLDNRDESYLLHDALPITCGNTHDNYHQAFYQNLRFKALYSSLLKVSTRYPRSVHLLDTVDVVIPDAGKTELDELHSGVYIVSAIKTTVDFESDTPLVTYTLVREGLTSDNVDTTY